MVRVSEALASEINGTSPRLALWCYMAMITVPTWLRPRVGMQCNPQRLHAVCFVIKTVMFHFLKCICDVLNSHCFFNVEELTSIEGRSHPGHTSSERSKKRDQRPSDRKRRYASPYSLESVRCSHWQKRKCENITVAKFKARQGKFTIGNARSSWSQAKTSDPDTPERKSTHRWIDSCCVMSVCSRVNHLHCHCTVERSRPPPSRCTWWWTHTRQPCPAHSAIFFLI